MRFWIYEISRFWGLVFGHGYEGMHLCLARLLYKRANLPRSSDRRSHVAT